MLSCHKAFALAQLLHTEYNIDCACSDPIFDSVLKQSRFKIHHLMDAIVAMLIAIEAATLESPSILYNGRSETLHQAHAMYLAFSSPSYPTLHHRFKS